MATQVNQNLMLYNYLTSVSALTTEVGHTSGTPRIFGPPLGIPSGITAPCKFLIFGDDGGTANFDVPMADMRTTFYLYGATQSEAQSVYRALHAALHRIQDQRITLATGSVALLRSANKETGPHDLPEPELNFPRVVCAYRVRYCEWTFAS